MTGITVWIDTFLQALHNIFTNRVWFVGLQGSYGRGEATEASLFVWSQNRIGKTEEIL